MHTSLERQWIFKEHKYQLQHGRTHSLLPETVLMHMQSSAGKWGSVLLHQRLQPAETIMGQNASASAGAANLSSPAAPKALPNSEAPANLSAWRREMEFSATPLASSSKECSTPVASPRKALIHPP